MKKIIDEMISHFQLNLYVCVHMYVFIYMMCMHYDFIKEWLQIYYCIISSLIPHQYSYSYSYTLLHHQKTSLDTTTGRRHLACPN